MSILKTLSDYLHLQVFILSAFSAMPLGILYKAVPAWLSEAQIGIAVITTFSIAKVLVTISKEIESDFIEYNSETFTFKPEEERRMFSNLKGKKSLIVFKST